MKAVVKFKDGKDGWEVRDVKRPDPMPDEVEIEVKAAGICGSELHLYHDNHVYEPPVTVGHEFCGVISRVGKDVKRWKVGDRVVSENNKVTCGVCYYCKTGMAVLCPERRSVGYYTDGGWTNYFCTPERLLIGIPDNVSDEEAAMTEPLSVATQALIVRGTVKPNDIVLVQGCGTIGLLNAMVAKAIGAKKVIITGTDVDEESRLKVARELGIDVVLNINRVNLEEEVKKETGGKGLDVLVEASGSDKGIYGMFGLIRKMGTIVALGESAQTDITFPWNPAVFRACTVHFSFGAGFEAWNLAMQLMEAKKVNLKPLISHRLQMSEFKKGFELLEKKEGLKIILLPEEYKED